MGFDWSKTLEELENNKWENPKHTTNLVRKCHELRRVPLNELTAENCRLLLGQHIGAPYLVPVALTFLDKNPLEAGHMLPGSLLKNVLDQEVSFWKRHPELWFEVSEVLFEINSIRHSLEELQVKENEFQDLQEGVLDQLKANTPPQS